MWGKGTLLINGITLAYEVKHYDLPSKDYGIEGGRISKLWIGIDGKTTLHYDRGWDMEPEDEASQLAYWTLMKKYN